MISFIIRLLLLGILSISMLGGWVAYPIVIIFWICIAWFVIRLGADIYWWWKT